MKRILLVAVIVIQIVVQGCTLASVNVEVLSERTALENQILGTYNALDKEMLLAASVRGVDEKGQIKTPPKKSRGRRDAVEAMQILDFHSDDLRRFKDLGWVGENSEGLTEVIHCHGVKNINTNFDFGGGAPGIRAADCRYPIVLRCLFLLERSGESLHSECDKKKNSDNHT